MGNQGHLRTANVYKSAVPTQKYLQSVVTPPHELDIEI